VELSLAVHDAFLNCLKHLFLGITDATGPGGSKDYLHWANEEEDGDDGFPQPNLQEIYPNVEYAYGLFDLVSRCLNLKSLGLSGTHILDGNLLDWKPVSHGLKDLYLHRVKFSSAKLIQLLSPSKNLTLKSSMLSRLWFEDVDLTAGEWSEVFDHLCKCSSLSYLNPHNMGYSRDGESSHLRMWSGRPWEDWMNLWSEHPPDKDGLVEVMDMLIERARGREDYYPLTLVDIDRTDFD
jgi:hypothetical protein